MLTQAGRAGVTVEPGLDHAVAETAEIAETSEPEPAARPASGQGAPSGEAAGEQAPSSAPSSTAAREEDARPGPTKDVDPDAHQPPSLWFFWIVAIVATALDLASKAWASKVLTGFDPHLGRPKSITLIANYADLQYAQNPGGAWSMLRSLPEVARRPFFLVVSTVASVFIASIYPRIDRRQWAMRLGLPLALGGALGNLADRIRNGWVVDFVHVWIKRGKHEYHWPTFNVADVWIVVGVGLMALDVLFSRRLRERLMQAEERAEDEARTEDAA
jgi:signal peptidase II